MQKNCPIPRHKIDGHLAKITNTKLVNQDNIIRHGSNIVNEINWCRTRKNFQK